MNNKGYGNAENCVLRARSPALVFPSLHFITGGGLTVQGLRGEPSEGRCLSITGGLKSESRNNFLAERTEISSSEGPTPEEGSLFRYG